MRTSQMVNEQQSINYGQLVRFETKDISKARNVISNVIHPQWLRVNDTDAFRFRYAAVHFSSLDFSLIEYGTTITVELGEQSDYYTVILPTTGTLKMRQGSRLTIADPDNAIIVSPMRSANLQINSDCRKWLVRIRRSALEQQLAKMLYRKVTTPLVFDSHMAVHSGPGASWRRTINYLKQELDCADSLYTDRTLLEHIEQILISGLLHNQAHNYTDHLEIRANEVLPGYVKRAESFIKQHAQEPITSENIVMAATVSNRTLYAGFKRYIGTSPMTYLNNVRMTGARQDLLDREMRKNITSVATKWNFNHLSRFSVNYKLRFGESPSDTLKRNTQ